MSVVIINRMHLNKYTKANQIKPRTLCYYDQPLQCITFNKKIKGV